MFAALATSIALAAAAPGAGVGFLSGGELMARCNEDTPYGASFCFAYIAGVHDAIRAYEEWLSIREFCIPRDTPQSDLRQAFVDRILANPDDRVAQAASVVTAALKARYACRAGTTSTAPVGTLATQPAPESPAPAK